MELIQQKVVRYTLILASAALVLALIIGIFQQYSFFQWIVMGGTLAVLLALLAAHVAGWRYDRQLLIIISTLGVTAGVPAAYLTDFHSFFVFMPPILSLVLLDSRWVIGSGIATYTLSVIFGLMYGGRSAYLDPLLIIFYGLMVTGLAAGRWIIEQAYDKERDTANRLQLALTKSETQSQELSERTMRLELAEQHLRELVVTLETPTIDLEEGVLLTPLVGYLDLRRLEAIQTRVLEQVYEQRSRYVLLDLSGVATVDLDVAQAFVHLVRMVQLLGCRVIVTGIQSVVAMKLITLEIQLLDVPTTASPQEALRLIRDTEPRSSRSKGATHRSQQ